MHVAFKCLNDKTTVVSLPHACLASGLFEDVHDGGPVNWHILSSLAEGKWGGSVDRFFADAVTAAGFLAEDEKPPTPDCAPVIIGWTSSNRKSFINGHEEPFGLVADISTALAILSRRVGDIYIGKRTPSYEWDSLFGRAFEFDENVGPAPQLDEEPWASYEWKLEKS